MIKMLSNIKGKLFEWIEQKKETQTHIKIKRKMLIRYERRSSEMRTV